MNESCHYCQEEPATMAVLDPRCAVLSAVMACRECADKQHAPAVPLA